MMSPQLFHTGHTPRPIFGTTWSTFAASVPTVTSMKWRKHSMPISISQRSWATRSQSVQNKAIRLRQTLFGQRGSRGATCYMPEIYCIVIIKTSLLSFLYRPTVC
ncbi:hypothetical protein ACEWY4_018579 [Coilia grayii]|uniref:Uncharacterized protein n=1 Tax=Coilia grayii TaxID=363190 RepID=A0ABD1JDV6_9TELE